MKKGDCFKGADSHLLAHHDPIPKEMKVDVHRLFHSMIQSAR